MSKSLKRVTAALAYAGLAITPQEIGAARTAAEAAASAGCAVDQIAKSIIFAGASSGTAILFITAGGNQVDAALASAVAQEPLGKADAALIRAQTGFAIGGVSPVGLVNPTRAFWDPRLSGFDIVYAAAGTPRHVFGIAPDVLQRLAGATTAKFTVQK
ncbi:YbaK/EbsC family protein [Yoonia sp. 208BN28-4]|uniref:YbaK/EbsC family protein n=1 Tax=Yoonia sp. 208BN28-4 TaxID=3126505 RepID=UPI00309E0A7A